jgi:hypothetical protein
MTMSWIKTTVKQYTATIVSRLLVWVSSFSWSHTAGSGTAGTAMCCVSDSDRNLCTTCLACKMSDVRNCWHVCVCVGGGGEVESPEFVQVLDFLSLQESVQWAVGRTATPDVLCLGPPGTVWFCQEPVPATVRRYAATMAGYIKLCYAHDAAGRHMWSLGTAFMSLHTAIVLQNKP